MTDLITVKGATYNQRVALYETSPDHPAGVAYVAHDMVAKVALTPEVQTRLASGLLVETTEEPTEPFAGYGAMTTAEIAAKMEKLGDIERVIVRQYEATHKKRKEVISAEPAPVDGYDGMNVTDVLALKETLTPDEWAALQSYEAGHKNRSSIIGAV